MDCSLLTHRQNFTFPSLFFSLEVEISATSLTANTELSLNNLSIHMLNWLEIHRDL